MAGPSNRRRERRDTVVVVGGGHNGLTCAALLAKAGRPTVLLEAREVLGGLAAMETFAGDFRVPGLLHDTSRVRDSVVDTLALRRHGLERRTDPVAVMAPRQQGEPLWIRGDRVTGSVASGDDRRYRAFRQLLARLSRAIAPLMTAPPPDPSGAIWPLLGAALRVRRLGAADMIELLRLAPMCAADWMRDAFEGERLRAAVAAPALTGSFAGPWSAGTAATLLLSECVAASEPGEIVGGPAALTASLEAAARAYGVQIRTGTRVTGIRLDSDGGVEGVDLQDGDAVEAGTVVATCDPRQTFLELVGADQLPAGLARAVGNIRMRGTTAKVHLGIKGKLETGDDQAVEAIRTGETLDQLEQAFDAVKYGRISEPPVLDVRIPSIADASLCPEGHHVVSIIAHFAPTDRRGGWTEAERDALGDAVVAELARTFPDLPEQIVAREVLTPADLQTRYALTGGHIHHGEHAPDQLLFMRPVPQCARYRSPIEGLYLGGSGSHPGGGITCAPGALAARALLA
jgi:phytoene dehydrogenase-like protein